MFNDKNGHIHIYFDAEQLEDYVKENLEEGTDVRLVKVDFDPFGDSSVNLHFVITDSKVNRENVWDHPRHKIEYSI